MKAELTMTAEVTMTEWEGMGLVGGSPGFLIEGSLWRVSGSRLEGDDQQEIVVYPETDVMPGET
jgi:hypothetical protein